MAAVGPERAAQLRELTLAVYERGAGIAAERGILLADTKLEFGMDARGRADPRGRGADPGLVPLVAGRALAARAGRSPRTTSSSCATGCPRTGTGRASPPPLPDEIVEQTRARYVEAYERITGLSFTDWPGA